MTLPNLNFIAILPQTIVIVMALLVLLLDAIDRKGSWSRPLLPWLALIAIVAAGATSVWLALPANQPQVFQDMAVADGFAMMFNLVILIAAGFGVALAYATIPKISDQVGAYYALLLLALAGMMTMGSGIDLIVIFLALEIFSLALYILVGFNREEPRSAEASLKYFLLGAFASGFFLYGVALLYGATASTNLVEIATALASDSSLNAFYLYAGTAMLIVGFGFKIAMVPFHSWTPDAYQGAPTPVTGFMSVATKAAAFAAFVRVFLWALPSAQYVWGYALAGLAIATMTLGNLAALRQTSLKRMLAYSGIAHAGYAMVGLVAGTSQGVSAVLFYLFVYAFMNLGAFAVVLAMEHLGDNDVTREQLAGLSDRQPLLAAAMAVFMFALAGIPPLAGFFAKLYVFGAAVEAGWIWLVVIGVLNSVLSAYYYLRVTAEMYFRRVPDEGLARRSGNMPLAGADASAESTLLAGSSLAVSAVVFIAAVGTVLIGIYPYPWATWFNEAARAMFGG
ncbi:MAG: NADH-quinone oxidoreductase subunit N [Chloroflexota bacterium]|nr:NADH-quinone oxidoreductase subunit N [Chloroflexota bacterium]